jgi:hypothetical protein
MQFISLKQSETCHTSREIFHSNSTLRNEISVSFYVLLMFLFPSLLLHSFLPVFIPFALYFYFALLSLSNEYIYVFLSMITLYLSLSLPLSFVFFMRDKIDAAFVSPWEQIIRRDFNVAWNS